jgi:hypothetical protein
MYKTITDLIQPDKDYPPRVHELDLLDRVLKGRIYDVLGKEFHEEREHGGEYIPLRKRRPSVRYNLCKVVVQDTVSLLFGEGQFPTIECEDHGQRNALRTLLKEAHVEEIMADAAIRGSVGSVAIQLRVLSKRLFFKVFDTKFLMPFWRLDAPDTLASITEKYKVHRDVLRGNGYSVSDDNTWYWFQRVWDDQREIWYLPWPVVAPIMEAVQIPVEDPARTVTHALGFVPWVWIRNLPGESSTDDPNDGACTFKAAIENMIEIDYQLSQAGRGLKYSSDPTLLIKEPAFAEQNTFVRSPAEAIVTSTEGDAKLLEISGTASGAVLEYVRFLRELALEAIHGNRTLADKLSAAQSGRALELMHQPLVWLASHLRLSYGEGALLALVNMVARVSRTMELTAKGEIVAAIPEKTEITLRWGPWFKPTGDDMVSQANAVATWRAAGAISQKTAIAMVAETVSVENVETELTEIQADQKAILAGKALAPSGLAIPQETPKPNGQKGNRGKGND